MAVKVIFLGDSGVGKTCLLNAVLGEAFSELHLLTSGAQYRSLRVRSDGGERTLHLWDTAGQEAFRSLTRSFARGAQIAVLCCDLTSPASLDGIAGWARFVADAAPAAAVILAATKCDLRASLRAGMLSLDDVDRKAAELQCCCVMTSAKTWEGIDDLTIRMAEMAQRAASATTTEQAPALAPVQEPDGCC
jgi:Ras-related protein Rab-2A